MKISEQIRQGKGTIWLAAVMNLIFLLLQVIVFYPEFETNDDVGVMSFVNGLKGTSDEHLVYVNSLWGKLLKGLYLWNNSIQWYTVIQYALLFVSFTAVTWVLLRWLKQPAALWLIAVLLAFFTYQGYVRLQYTKSAGIYTAAGLLLIFYSMSHERIKKAAWLIGFFLALVGSFYRFDQFLCGFALFTAVGLHYLLTAGRQHTKSAALRCFGTAALLGICAVLGKGADALTYSQPDWQAYKEYDAARSSLLDYGVPDYDTYSETYAQLQMDRTAYNLLRGWTNADTEKITADTYRQLTALREKKAVNADFFRAFVNKVGPGILKIHAFWCAVIMAAVWLVKGRKGPAEWLTVIYLLGVTAALYLFLFYRGRVLFNRVDTGIWLAAALIFLWLLDRDKISVPRVLGGILLIVALLGTVYVGQDHLRVIRQPAASRVHENTRAVLEEIHADHDHLYLMKFGTISYAAVFSIWEPVPWGIGDNQYPLGGWTANSPVYMDVLKAYGVGNPFRDMIDNDKVYLIDHQIDRTVRYLQTWYNADAHERLVREAVDYKIYQIVTE